MRLLLLLEMMDVIWRSSYRTLDILSSRYGVYQEKLFKKVEVLAKDDSCELML